MKDKNRAEARYSNAPEQAPSDELSGLLMHVRYAGNSKDIPLDILHINPSLSDEAIREAVAVHLDLKAGSLDGCIVERHVNGNMTIRPEAVFG